MRKILAVLVLALVCLVQPSLSAPYDPPTWRDSTWDYRSEDSTDLAGEVSYAKVQSFPFRERL